MRQIHATVLRVGAFALIAKNIKVVAAHTTHHRGPYPLNFALVRCCERLRNVADALRSAGCRGERAERGDAAVGEPRVCAEHVVNHVAVRDGT